MDVHQFAASLSYGDAISDEMLEIQSVLREKGFRSEIFVKMFDPKSAKYIKDYREYKKSSSPKNVVIFHFSIGSAVSKLFFRVPDKKMMIYHNITPHEFFVDSHRVLARECYKGRLEINLFVDKVDLAVGDSEFNRQELEAVGYKAPAVLPILMNFSKFDGRADAVAEKIFDNGKTTLLYVGRLIPNKKFEDVLKTYHFYKSYFNPDSQLILAGDYRGLERHFASLQELVAKLKIMDVHFSGHVEFAELLAFYRAADFYISMSEHEGFGVPLLEAFYNKIPVIGYAAGAVEETMNGGGVTLYKKDFLKTAALIDRIQSDGALKARIIEGQLRSLEKYSRENVSRILIEHIERVSGG